MALASAGLELPATSLIAPLLAAIAVSRGLGRRLITSRQCDWQYGARGKSRFFRGKAQCFRRLSRQRDGVDVPPVVRLLAMDAAAVAEEGRAVLVGAAADILDLSDAGAGQSRGNVPGEIE